MYGDPIARISFFMASNVYIHYMYNILNILLVKKAYALFMIRSIYASYFLNICLEQIKLFFNMSAFKIMLFSSAVPGIRALKILFW